MSEQGRFTAALQTIVTHERSAAFRWGTACALFVLAFVVRYTLADALPPGFPYLTFFPAVIVTTLVCGLWPGIVSASLCGLASWFFFIAPANSFDLNPGALTALLFYAFIVSVDIFIIHGITVTAQHLRAERETMVQLATSLQHTNAELAQSEGEQQVLSQEIGHRLKNQLALVQAIVSQSMRAQSDLPTISKVLTDRLSVLADTQDMLIAGNVAQADVGDIVQNVVALHGDDVQGRFVIDGPAIKLASKPALSLSMILHELATNATKYGALSSGSGVVRIDWGLQRADAEQTFVLHWREEGGPTVTEPSSRGFGSRLIAAGLPGAGSRVVMAFKPDGMSCELSAGLAGMQSEQAI